jgi:transposase
MRIPEDATPRERELYAIIERLEARVARQDERIAELEAKLAKASRNSSNSSKPPSSDIVKPPGPRPPSGGGRRKIGGQPGHPRHERASFPPDEVGAVRTYKMRRCPRTGGRLRRADLPPKTMQQIGLVDRPFVVTEHRAYAYRCEGCNAVHWAPFPAEVRAGGLLDARATAFVAFLKGACHASYSTIRTFFADHMGVSISRGQLAKTVAKASEALAAPYEEMARRLPDEPRVNVDETGHKDPERIVQAGTDGPPPARPLAWWTWAFCAGPFTLFKIVDSRGSNVLIDTLGREFEGVLGSDCFPAYLKYMRDFNVILQLCLAHLIREVKFLAEHPDAAVRAYGARFLAALKALFDVIHRREEMTARGFRRELKKAKRGVLKAATRRVPAHPDAERLAKRMRGHGEAYFTFVTTPGIEPTNNLAERAIRFVVIDRRITQGTRGERGRKWCERIWTVIATSAQQGRSVYRFLVDAVRAHFAGARAPSLLPSGP